MKKQIPKKISRWIHVPDLTFAVAGGRWVRRHLGLSGLAAGVALLAGTALWRRRRHDAEESGADPHQFTQDRTTADLATLRDVRRSG